MAQIHVKINLSFQLKIFSKIKFQKELVDKYSN